MKVPCFCVFTLLEQKVSLLHVMQVRLDRQEDAMMVCRLDQLANHADGLCARVEETPGDDAGISVIFPIAGSTKPRIC